MKVLIVCISIHHGNTEKIAKAIAKPLGAKIIRPNEFNVADIDKYDLIGFGSGIYFSKHHRSLLNIADKLPDMRNKKVFIFSTSGLNLRWLFHRELKQKLIEKNAEIIEEFSCKGFDSYGLLKLIGGINKGRPNEKDLREAEKFGHKLKEKLRI